MEKFVYSLRCSLSLAIVSAKMAFLCTKLGCSVCFDMINLYVSDATIRLMSHRLACARYFSARYLYRSGVSTALSALVTYVNKYGRRHGQAVNAASISSPNH